MKKNSDLEVVFFCYGLILWVVVSLGGCLYIPLLLFDSAALAADDDHELPARVPVHVGVDAVTPVPEVEPGFAAHALVTDMVTPHFGLSFSTRLAVEESIYAEIYVGPTLRLGRHFMVTPSIGIESADMPLRGAGALAWTDHRFEAFGVFEYGGSGAWYMASANVWLKAIGVGAYAQRFDGLGPWLAVRFDHEHLVFWTAPVYEPEEATAGIMAGFEFARH